MPNDVPNPATGAPDRTDATGNPNAPAGDPGQPQNRPTEAPAAVSREEFQKLQRTIDWMASRVKAVDPSNPKTRQDIPDDEKENTLRKRVDALESRQVRYAQKRRVDALRDAARSEGVPADRLDILVNHLDRQFGERLIYDDNADAVRIRDELIDDRFDAVETQVRTFLKSASGQMFFNAPNVSSIPRNGSGNGGGGTGKVPYADLPSEQRLKMQPHERSAYIRANG